MWNGCTSASPSTARMAAPSASFDRAFLSGTSWVAVTPGATVLSPTPIALFIGTGGNLSLTDALGNTVLFKNVPSGSTIRVRPSVVPSDSTTATDIVAIYG